MCVLIIIYIFPIILLSSKQCLHGLFMCALVCHEFKCAKLHQVFRGLVQFLSVHPFVRSYENVEYRQDWPSHSQSANHRMQISGQSVYPSVSGTDMQDSSIKDQQSCCLSPESCFVVKVLFLVSLSYCVCKKLFRVTLFIAQLLCCYCSVFGLLSHYSPCFLLPSSSTANAVSMPPRR